MENLKILKETLNGILVDQLAVQNEFAQRFESLGYSLHREWNFPHPTEDGKFISINGGTEIVVTWKEKHCCDEDCGQRCDGTHVVKCPATAEEVFGAIKLDLIAQIRTETSELVRLRELVDGFLKRHVTIEELRDCAKSLR